MQTVAQGRQTGMSDKKLLGTVEGKPWYNLGTGPNVQLSNVMKTLILGT